MGSHELAARYEGIPAVFWDSLRGKDYELPEFGSVDPNLLRAYRIALVVTHGPELPEFDVPVTFLRERGAAIDVITQDWLFDHQPPDTRGKIALIQWIAAEVCVQADKRVSDARAVDYDAVLIIGGAWNPIMLRTDQAVIRFVRAAHEGSALVASICHGPQVLISTEAFPPGTHMTGVADIRGDLKNAGFDVRDDPVVYDEEQRLITSPSPDELGPFCEAIARSLLAVPPRQQRGPAMEPHR